MKPFSNVMCGGLVHVGVCNGSCSSKLGLGMFGMVMLWKLFRVAACVEPRGLEERASGCLPTVFWDPFRSAAIMGYLVLPGTLAILSEVPRKISGLKGLFQK